MPVFHSTKKISLEPLAFTFSLEYKIILKNEDWSWYHPIVVRLSRKSKTAHSCSIACRLASQIFGFTRAIARETTSWQ